MSIANAIYDDILFNWDSDIPKFRMFLVEVCGIHMNDETFLIMKQEVNTLQDLDQFVELFDGDIGNIHKTINKFLVTRQSAA